MEIKFTIVNEQKAYPLSSVEFVLDCIARVCLSHHFSFLYLALFLYICYIICLSLFLS